MKADQAEHTQAQMTDLLRSVNNTEPNEEEKKDALMVEINMDDNDHLKSTLKKNDHERAWIDPWEPAVQETFYHKQMVTLRPTFDIVAKSIEGASNLDILFNELHQPPSYSQDDEDDEEHEENPSDQELEEEEEKQQESKKFGPWEGVMARCLLNIFGVIMFLRVGFVVGQAGIIQALLIIAISSIITILTSLSMTAICTNGTILGGGAYYIISRALGPSIGGAIGILFSVGNMAAVSLYLIGFAETLTTNLSEQGGFTMFDDPIMDIRIWSNITLCLVLILSILGLNYVVKTQLFLLGFICIAILLFFIGSFYKEVYNDNYLVITPKGWINGNFIENLSAGYDGYDFWSVLAIFFPAVTGIMAGANISGDLKNPSSDIPKGTFSAIFISTIMYMLMAIFVGAVTVRSELLTNELVMALICVWDYIILIGIYAATLSSAIASLVGAPRILQAVANDKLFDFKIINYFGVTNKNGEPIRGYYLSFIVAFIFNLIGSLNGIAPLISQFFMLTYLFINAGCLFLEFSKSPGWRPSFKYFNKWTAGIGTLLCLIIMFLLNWPFALIAIIITGLLAIYVYFKDPEVNWGAAPQARKYFNAYKSILRLRKTPHHTKNWRPGLLVLCRDPIKRAQMVLFAQTLKKGHGPIFYATVHTGDYRTNIHKFQEAHSFGYLPLNVPKGSKGFYESVLSDTLRGGVQNLCQLVGMGSIRPNILVIGYKRKWRTDSDEIITEYVQILRDALIMRMGLMICVGFKRINWFLDEYAPPALQHDIDDYPDIYAGGLTKTKKKDHVSDVSPIMDMPRNKQQEQEAIVLSKAWASGQGKDTVIDVWWMIDDGGLCMLIPYIMRRHQFWQNCTLRILMVTQEDNINGADISTMKELIDRFRLPYKGPLLVPAKKEPHHKTIQQFETLAKCKIDDVTRPSIIRKWLILSELLFEYSRYSGLNVVTLPIPTKAIQPRAYMALLHMISDQERLPPTIIMRGNGESTLTFYSE